VRSPTSFSAAIRIVGAEVSYSNMDMFCNVFGSNLIRGFTSPCKCGAAVENEMKVKGL